MPLVALLGAPQYHSRFGFVPAKEFGVIPPENADKPGSFHREYRMRSDTAAIIKSIGTPRIG